MRLPLILLYAGYGFGALFGLLFLISMLRTNWYQHAWGRNVVVFDVLLTVTEGFVFTGLFFREIPGRTQIGVGLILLIAVAQCWRWVIQFNGNRRQRRMIRQAAAKEADDHEVSYPA